jgi:serine protease
MRIGRRSLVLTTLAAAVFAASLFTSSATAADPNPQAVASVAAGQIAKVLQSDGSYRWQPVALAAAGRINGQGLVARAVTNHVFHVLDVPDDTYYDEQWNLTQIGLETAWNTTTGSGITVAVVDTGVTPGPDLACRTFVAPYDAFSGDETMDAVTDRHGHGTHVIGTVGECSDNALGLAGVAWNVTIMPIRVLDASGSGTSLTLANGIMHAVEHGADVINLSLGFDCEGDAWPVCSSPAVDNEIQAAIDAGVVVVAASGNDGTNDLNYPAVNPNVIAVGASNSKGAATSYSNGGSALTVMAP